MPPAFSFRRSPERLLVSPRQLAERAFDFAQLDAISSDFDLLVATTEELDCAIWPVAGDRRCDTSARPGASKLLLATQGIVEIAFRDPNAANP